ncbi:hypothetical protein JTE90_003983 [Oedothorax gibbosus]|uniref:Thyroglobulin type-1 domain-containing protein n=1 Tax=Oedothorax gibbosus TaxID=931172 RepID=A0AAV6UCQ6_9ARAC|nr:hypothetical protein JTE90_003983 [Oedothorax gibbosus]
MFFPRLKHSPFPAMKTFSVLFVLCLAVAVRAQTQCEEHRERELKNDVSIKLIPKCNEDGDYEEMQCFQGDNPYCMCWHTDGTAITTPSKNLKTCACHNHRYRELLSSNEGMVGNFVPTCNSNGTYAKKQCHGSTGYCWCADEEGTRVSEEVRGELEC